MNTSTPRFPRSLEHRLLSWSRTDEVKTDMRTRDTLAEYSSEDAPSARLWADTEGQVTEFTANAT
jgi:hypothetical protein